MPRRGLVAVQRTIRAKGKVFKRTYWIKKKSKSPAKKAKVKAFGAEDIVAVIGGIRKGEKAERDAGKAKRAAAEPGNPFDKLGKDRVEPLAEHIQLPPPLYIPDTTLKKQRSGTAYVMENQKPLKKLNEAINISVRTLAGADLDVTPSTPGPVTALTVSDQAFSNPNALAFYRTATHDIFLRRKTGAELRRLSMAREGATDKHVSAVATVAHEMLHGTSNPNDHYEGISSFVPRGAKEPYAAIEEATTELLARHYAPQLVRAFTPRGMSDDVGNSSPTRTGVAVSGDTVYRRSTADLEDDVAVRIPIAYQAYCQQFARVACYAEGLDSKSPTEELHRATTYHATVAKTLSGPARYAALAERIMRKKGFSEFDLVDAEDSFTPAERATLYDRRGLTADRVAGRLKAFMTSRDTTMDLHEQLEVTMEFMRAPTRRLKEAAKKRKVEADAAAKKRRDEEEAKRKADASKKKKRKGGRRTSLKHRL